MTPKERVRIWRANNRERHREYSHKYYYEHRDECLQKAAVYQRDHMKQHNENTKKWHKEHPDYKKTYHHFRRYKITPEDYQKMLDEQDGKCAICGSDDSGLCNSDRLHIDHDHKTGLVRGLLCGHCNVMLGGARDDLQILLNAINYLGRQKQCRSEAA